MGVVPPAAGFLQALRRLTEAEGSILIFDEVMSCFRVHPGGAQTLYGVRPDLTTLGKVFGGGLPVGAYGSRREIMQMIAPSGPVYPAGTLSGNPLAMAAGIETLRQVRSPGVGEALEKNAATLEQRLREAARKAGAHVVLNRVGTMFTTFFTDRAVTGWETGKTSNTKQYAEFFRAMLEGGVYLAPSQFEAGFLSTAHGGEEIEATVDAAGRPSRGANCLDAWGERFPRVCQDSQITM